MDYSGLFVEDGDTVDIKTALGLAIGAASVLWDDLSEAGVFHGTQAIALVDALNEIVENALDRAYYNGLEASSDG